MKKSGPRREHLRFLAGASLVPIIGCGDDGARSDVRDGAADGSLVDAATQDGNHDSSLPTDAGASWARGGTKAMTQKDNYPEPFGGVLDSCALVASTTAGPCTTMNDIDRTDISEGWIGLPVRLALKVVDVHCQPVEGALVSVWHTNIEGSYSGETPSNGFCLLNPEHASANFFRGVQTTDSKGLVYFDTCYPGWYPGRAIHIHFQVKRGGVMYRTSQLFFEQSLTRQIFANHPEYSPYGQPDTSVASDGITASLSLTDLAQLTLKTERMSDGAMLASKVVTAT